MRKLQLISIAIFALIALFVGSATAQYYNVPLTMEGVDHTSNGSVLSRSMGGVTIPLQKNISLMFANPAGLTTLDAIQVSVGGTYTFSKSEHTQQWYPMVYFGNISILMDGTVRGIDSIRTSYNSTTNPYPGDTLRKPYDDIWPAWSHEQNKIQVPDIFVAMPLTVADQKVSVGLGYTDYANLDYFYRNNNTLSADFGLMVIPSNPAPARDSVRDNWSQNTHYRMGAIHSYGAAISTDIDNKFSVGVSGRILSGKSDDYDLSLGRGVIWVVGSVTSTTIWNVNNGYIRCDSVDYMKSLVGSSDYSGFELTGSGTYRNKNITIGFSITLPTTIKREFSGKLTCDTAKTIDYNASYSSRDTSFTEKMKLPLKAKIGIGFNVRSNVSVAAEYEYCPYSTAELEKNGVTTRPWLDASSFHFGIDWAPADYLSLRFGYRKQVETFHAEYSALNDPITSSVYTAGFGITCMPNLVLNFAYEYYSRKYEDAWVYAYHVNTITINALSAELVYTLK
jgi:long-subunit fatty acid transport protein